MSKKYIKNIINEYLKLDQTIKEKEISIKEFKTKMNIQKMKENKSKLAEFIKKFFIENNINYNIKIGSDILKLDILEKKESLSQKFIKKALENYFIENYPNKKKQDCVKKANEIFESILKGRKIKEISSLKRLSI
jgi:hypothetical protein